MAKKSFKIGKFNVKGALTRSAVIAATGAAAQVVATLVEGEIDPETTRPKNAEIVDYAMIGAGILLPEVMKGNAMIVNVADAALAIGSYRMAVAYDLSGKIGVNGIGTSSDVHMIGSQQWKPKYTNNKVSGSKQNKSGANASAVV
jgi:hypothetical protein